MVTKGLNKITQNETQDLQLVDNFCKSWVLKLLTKALIIAIDDDVNLTLRGNRVYVDYGCSQFAIDIEGNSLVEMVKKVVAQL